MSDKCPKCGAELIDFFDGKSWNESPEWHYACKSHRTGTLDLDRSETCYERQLAAKDERIRNWETLGASILSMLEACGYGGSNSEKRDVAALTKLLTPPTAAAAIKEE